MKVIDPRRLDETEKRYLAGTPTKQIERELAAQFNIKPGQVRRYIAIVRKRVSESFAATSEEERRAHLNALLHRAYQTAEAGGLHGPDAKAMVAAVKTMAEIEGLTAPKKFELTAKVDVSADAILREIQAVAGTGPSAEPEPRGLLEAQPTGTDGTAETGEGSQGDSERASQVSCIR